MTSPPRLLVLDAAYSLPAVRSRQLEHSITSRDLGGFFDHVWSVHPLVGADPLDTSTTGKIESHRLDPRNTFIEARVGRFGWLSRLPVVNLLIAQVALLIYLQRLIRKEGISCIRVGDPYYLGLVGLVLARVNRIPLVIRVNGNYDAVYEQTGRPAYPRLLRSRRFEKRVEHFIFPRADLVAGANQDNLDYALANGAQPERATIFRYGTLIAPEHFEDPAARQPIRDEIGFGASALLVYVGRLEPVKHVDDVIGAFALVAAERDDVRLLVVGDGSLRDELALAASRLGVVETTKFVGNREQRWIARAFADADVVLSPLTGRALVEAGLSGTVIVAYDVEWHAEVLEDRLTGRLVGYRDVRGMAEAVKACLNEPNAAALMGSRCRQHVLEMMDPERLMEHERRAFATLLGIAGVAMARS